MTAISAAPHDIPAERFSFYGMQALLMLYMTRSLLLPEQARHVLGLASRLARC